MTYLFHAYAQNDESSTVINSIVKHINIKPGGHI